MMMSSMMILIGVRTARVADYQCMNCRVIVGDSCAYVASDPDLKVAALRAASSVAVDPSTFVRTSRGRDAGSSASLITCASCGEELGVVYKTTPKEIDSLRGMFCFNTDCICSYELGNPQVVADGAEPTGGDQRRGGGAGPPPPVRDEEERSVMRDKVEKLEEQMLKVENMMLLFNERIGALECTPKPGMRRRLNNV